MNAYANYSQAHYQNAYNQAVRRGDKVLWACAIAAVLLGIVAAAQNIDRQANQADPSAAEFPAMGEPAPTAESFQAIQDGRVPPGEAIIGVNEVAYQQGNCPNGQCPLTYTSYQPNPYTPANYAPPAATYPPGYSAPQYYQQTASDCDCENCNCRGRFPVARAAGRVTWRVVTAPFRFIRNRRGCN